MARFISDTHQFIHDLSRDEVFSPAQAKRLKEVIGDQFDVVTKDDLERSLQRVVIQLLVAMLAQAALIIAAVQWITSV